jgi:hypothetical protein
VALKGVEPIALPLLDAMNPAAIRPPPRPVRR